MTEEEFRTGINPSCAVTTPIPFHRLETLRDRFAMAALHAQMSCKRPWKLSVEDSYIIADAMMEARKT